MVRKQLGMYGETAADRAADCSAPAVSERLCFRMLMHLKIMCYKAKYHERSAKPST